MDVVGVKKRLGVFTSGGDAPGMNAAVRAVVRAALNQDLEVYAIYEGYQGMVEGGERIRKMDWDSVGGILARGGTIIGTARCLEFQTREGRRQAARNLVEYGIEALVAIGGDGSLTGATILHREWPELLAELVENGEIGQEMAVKHAHLALVGLPASIDNDLYGSDMTIGTDTALHRIAEAADAISSTASSHQRTFIIEVMGRNCGYLALMGGLATGADWVMIPEKPPAGEHWEEQMCQVLKAGRDSGRRDTIVMVAEGARDAQGNPIRSDDIKKVLEERLGEDARVTILGHVQRGGSPSAFDRNLSTLLGYAAVAEVLADDPSPEPVLMGLRGNRITRTPLSYCVENSRKIAAAIASGDYPQAMALRGDTFGEIFHTFSTLMQATPPNCKPDTPPPIDKPLRIAVLTCGAAASGMNTAVRAAVRLGIDKCHTMLGVENGFRGLIEGHIRELDWVSVRGWATTGGSSLGTSRKIPKGRDLYDIARRIEKHDIHALLIIGGWSGYQAAYQLYNQRENFPAFNIPIICIPATINNNLPGSEYSIGSDTALNNIIQAVDKIKQSAVASNRCFVVKVMGRYCGYLALLSGMATGAEQVYLHEDGVTLSNLQHDLDYLINSFERGKRLGLIICNENAHPVYNSDFISALFAEEGKKLFQVRQAVLGHLQQGGDPSPFDRIQATRLAAKAIDFLIAEADKHSPAAAAIGLQGSQVQFWNLSELPVQMDTDHQRPKHQWWWELRDIASNLSHHTPHL
ncbi:6-phosphofructokinase [[Phormidium] sp. ETS-05]|uniref:6-phosphofructokinase n=1 Tax=[Phormidium] sp. ETS-05 TaxID=222819 RepID=UPI001E555065|nr:6-phosphofructokinase [[Phormidium] sp. ETS-05]